MEIKIPLAPLSINEAFFGKHIKTPKCRQFEKDAMWFIKGKKVEGEAEVKYKFFLKNYKKTDVGNLEKITTDLLVKKGILQDDRFIKRLVLEKYQAKEDSIEILINKYE